MLTYHNDIEALFEARWLTHSNPKENDDSHEGYALVNGVVSAIRENRPFVPESLECADTQEFVERLAGHVRLALHGEDVNFADIKVWVCDLVKANRELPVCRLALGLGTTESMVLLMMVVADYCIYAGTDNEGIGGREVQMVYSRDMVRNSIHIAHKMQSGTHELFQSNLIEHKCVEGMADVNKYVCTGYVKDVVLEGFAPAVSADMKAVRMKGLKPCGEIVPRRLHYNAREAEQVDRLMGVISQEQLPMVQERLRAKGMRTGVCVLMHGAPGTGKTATAYELARQTGRDIVQVQVTDFKNKYVGESEARLKRIFESYRQCCRKSETLPILLLNEGDAILSKRCENVDKSVEQMSNALQNILLEEMENLEGIMIVTTNLTSNLDSAFERRFIFKVRFERPGLEARACIWRSMIEELDEADARELAGSFDLSGGEIENIARKTVMEYVLTGNRPDVEMVRRFAENERLEAQRKRVSGFGA